MSTGKLRLAFHLFFPFLRRLRACLLKPNNQGQNHGQQDEDDGQHKEADPVEIGSEGRLAEVKLESGKDKQGSYDLSESKALLFADSEHVLAGISGVTDHYLVISGRDIF